MPSNTTIYVNTMNYRGKLVILLIFVTATAMGGFAWWHQFQGGRRCVEFWGTRTIYLIQYASRAVVLDLMPAERAASLDLPPEAERLSFSGMDLVVSNDFDVSQARGLIHARHALVDDASFEADPAADDCPATWEFAFRFTQAGEQVTVLFDPQCRWIGWLEGNRRMRLRPQLANAFRIVRDDWLVRRESSGPVTPPAAPERSTK